MQDLQLVPLVFKTLQLATWVWQWNRTSRLSGELQASDLVLLICMSLRGILWIVKCSYTVMRRLTMGIRLEKCVVRRFRHSANVIQCTYTKLDSIAYYILSLYGIAYCYKPVQHVTVLNTVGKCNTIVLYYNIMGPPSYIRSVVDWSVVMRHMTVHDYSTENNDNNTISLFYK